MSVNPDETAYYLRLVSMYIDLATESVLNLFTKYSPDGDAVKFLKSEEEKLDELKRRKVLNKQEHDTVLARPLELEQFDVSLLITLSINLLSDQKLPPPRRGWNDYPRKGDTSVAADLLRLRRIRNAIVGHHSKSQLEQSKFDIFWKEVSEILLRLQQEIEPKNEEKLKQKLEYYRLRSLDSCIKTKTKYDEKLKKWLVDISEIQNEVEELAMKLKGFEVYFRSKSDRYERYIKLLVEGGRSVLLSFLKSEIAKQEKDLRSILDEKEVVLKNALKNQDDIRKLYPLEHGTKTLDEWDISLLATVIWHVLDCNEVVIGAVEMISNARDNYINVALIALDSNTFEDYWTDLKASIQIVASFLPQHERSKCLKILDECKKKADNSESFKTYMDELESQGLQMKSFQNIFTETLKKTKDFLQKMITDGIDFKSDRELIVKIITLGTDHEKETLAEDILTEVWRAAVCRSGENDDFYEVREEVYKILTEIETTQGTKKVTVLRECIILQMSCSNPGKMLSLINYFESSTFKETLGRISKELGYSFNTVFTMFACLQIDCLHEIVTCQNQSGTEDTGIKLPITVSSPAGMMQLKTLLKSEKMTNCSDAIADALSKHLKDPVSMRITTDLRELDKVFEEMESSPSSSNSSCETEEDRSEDVDCKDCKETGISLIVSLYMFNIPVQDILTDALKHQTLSQAADIYLQRMMKKPNWFEDVMRDLEHTGHISLANACRRFTLTVPVRWSISSFTDAYGKASFNDFSDQRQTNQPIKVTSKKDYECRDADQGFPQSKRPLDVSEIELCREDSPIHKDKIEREHTKSKVIRSRSRLTVMEKVNSLIQTPTDLPVAVYKLGKMNLQLTKVSNCVFMIYIGSLDALMTFEQLSRCGGLKKIIDKEILGRQIVKDLKAVVAESGHVINNIQSQIEILETDIERCRSSLLKTTHGTNEINTIFNQNWNEISVKGFRPVNFVDAILLTNSTTSFEGRDIAFDHFYTDRLPDELSCMLEDPFVTDRIERYIKYGHGDFIEWLNRELVQYLNDLDTITKLHLLTIAIYLVHVVSPGGSKAIPYEVLSENFAVKEVKTFFPIGLSSHGCWFNLIELPGDVRVDIKSLHTACKDLLDKGILCRRKNSINSLSFLIRDVFVTRVVMCSSYKGRINPVTQSFGYVQTLIGLWKHKMRNDMSHQAESELHMCTFKTDELRRSYGEDCSLDRMQAGLQPELWMKLIRDLDVSNQRNSLFIANKVLTDETLEIVGLHLHKNPVISNVKLVNCQLKDQLLANVLERGYFENIRTLNISDNVFQDSTQPFGLMHIPSLKSLQINNCHLGDEGIKRLALDLHHMSKLTELNIASNEITSHGLMTLTKALGANRWMTGLRIHKNYIGKDGSLILASWLESLILLEVLNISECGIGDKGIPIIASALVSRSLKKLSMRKNGLTHKGSSDFFKCFHRPPYLEHLDFSDNALFPASDRSILAMPEDLSPTASDEPFLKFLQHPTPLSHLSLWNTCVGEKRVFQELYNHPCFEEMTYLCLQENNISNEFARDVSECIKQSKCSHLQHFNLRQNRIGNLGAIDIAKALSGQKYLKEVLLDRNEIGDEGADHIVKSCISLPSIEKIDLSCNNVSRNMTGGIVDDLENKITDTNKGVAGTYFVRNQSSLDENSFRIVKDGDKVLITT